MANDMDEIYGTGSQVDFARQMARILMGQKGFQMSPGMAVLPGSWAYGVPDIVKQLSGAQYRDIAGSQDKALRDRPTDPDYQTNVKRYGGFAKPSAPHGTAHKAAMATGALPTTRSVKTMPVTPFKNMEAESEVPPNSFHDDDMAALHDPVNNLRDGMSTTVKPAIPDFETEVNPAPQTKGINFNPQDEGISYPTQGNLEDELDKLVNSPAHKDKPAHVKQAAKDQFRRLAEEARGHFGRDVTVSEAIWYAQNKGTLEKSDLGAPPERMNLGGPDAESIPPHLRADETKVAQSFNAPTATESSSSKFQKIPGYDGPLPNAPYVESDAEIRAQMRLGSQQDAQKVLNDWKKRLEPYEIPTQNGRLQVTPRKGGTADFKFIPSDKTLEIGKGSVPMQRHVDPEGKPYWSVITPSGPKAFRSEEEAKKASGGAGLKGGDYEKVVKELNQVEGEAKGANILREQGLADIAEAKKKGREAFRTRQILQEMKVTNETDWKPTGPTANFMLKARQFLSNFGFPDSQSTTDAEVQKKLNAFLASRIVNTFTDRGSNFELQSFMEANPGLQNTQAGTRMLLDIMDQENEQVLKIRKLADKETAETAHEWAKKESDFYEKNPITIPHDGKRIHLLPLQNASPEEARAMVERLPKGAYFWDANTKSILRRK